MIRGSAIDVGTGYRLAIDAPRLVPEPSTGVLLGLGLAGPARAPESRSRDLTVRTTPRFDTRIPR